MPVEVYESALEQAKNDLSGINGELEKLRVRKELVEKFLDALTPLISNLNPAEGPTAPPQAVAPVTPVPPIVFP
jgi:hypothetical protein